jgi:hypothetical protein
VAQIKTVTADEAHAAAIYSNRSVKDSACRPSAQSTGSTPEHACIPWWQYNERQKSKVVLETILLGPSHDSIEGRKATSEGIHGVFCLPREQSNVARSPNAPGAGRSGADYEIIVIDDGSADETADRRRLAANNASGVHHPHNRGYRAFQSGFRRRRRLVFTLTATAIRDGRMRRCSD